MKLAYSLNSFRKFSVTDAIKGIAKIGYGGVEIMADQPHAWPDDLSDAEIDTINKTIRDCSLKVSNINAFMTTKIGTFHRPSWIEDEENERRKRVEYTKKCIELSQKLNSQNLSTEPGGPVNDGEDRKSQMELFHKGLSECLPLLKEYKQKLLIEPEPGLLIENTEQFIEIIGKLDQNYYGLNFDIGHFYCVNEDIYELPYKLKNYIRHIHLEDIASDRKHYHLPPGEGSIDFKRLFRSLNDTGYDGWITIELYPFQNDPFEKAEQAFNYIQPLFGA